MVLVIILALVALTAIGLMFWALRGAGSANTSAEELESRLQQVDFEAFLTLTNPSETLFLSRALPRNRFRQVQRMRIAAVIGYLRALSWNAAILIRIGDLASQSDDAEVAESGRVLSNTALRTRVLVLRAYAYLLPQWIFPSSKQEWRLGVVDHYHELKRCLTHLVSVQEPAMTSRSVSLL